MTHNTMGAVFRAKDLPAGWRKRVQESIKDLSPDTKDSVLKDNRFLGGYKIRTKTKRNVGS
ncbi:MAG: hypothetical protein ACJ71M_01285 [Nitrososphaeraceae archaeon]